MTDCFGKYSGHTMDFGFTVIFVIVWNEGGLTILFLPFCLLTGSSSLAHKKLCP